MHKAACTVLAILTCQIFALPADPGSQHDDIASSALDRSVNDDGKLHKRAIDGAPLINQTLGTSPIPPLKGIDPQFTMIEETEGQKPLDKLSCFMTAILIVADHYRFGLDHRLIPQTVFKREFGDIEIKFSGWPEGQDIDQKFLFWGLVLYVTKMAQRNRYATAKLILRLANQPVGVLEILKRNAASNNVHDPVLPTPEEDSNTSSPFSNHHTMVASAENTFLQTSDIQNLSVGTGRVVHRFQNAPLTVERFFMPIMHALVGIASDDQPRERVQPFASDPANPPSDHVVCLVLHSAPPRTGPPFFTYTWAAWALGRMAQIGLPLAKERGIMKEITAVLERGEGESWVPVGRFIIRNTNAAIPVEVS